MPLSAIPAATPTFAVPGADQNHPAFTEAIPLGLDLCRDCGMLQVSVIVSPELTYRNYVYRTSGSLGLAEHFARYAGEVRESVKPATGALVVEIGSNDGTLLRCFAEAGHLVLGIDPAEEIARSATASGVETWPRFFNGALGREVRAKYGPAQIIIANNVFANIDDLSDLVSGLKELLASDGVFVMETQYGADVITKTLLDTVYHEHLSYFMVRPLQRFFAASGLELIDVQNIWTKGGSIRLGVQHAGGPRRVASSVARLVADEIRLGMDQPAFYRPLVEHVASLRARLGELVEAERQRGRGIAGYGVSVGTTTLIAQFDLAAKIDFLMDDDPRRGDHLIGPGYRLPIRRPSELDLEKTGAVVIFAWRYADPIMAKHSRYLAGGGKFIVPLPDVAVHGG